VELSKELLIIKELLLNEDFGRPRGMACCSEHSWLAFLIVDQLAFWSCQAGHLGQLAQLGAFRKVWISAQESVYFLFPFPQTN
jgi:hypothetical protein